MAVETEQKMFVLESGDAGEVRIADDVVAIMAGLAAVEVDGVTTLGGGITREMISKHGIKGLSKGVNILMEDNQVTVKLNLNLAGGFNIPDVCGKVQDRVKSALETMTGLDVKEVNIAVLGIDED